MKQLNLTKANNVQYRFWRRDCRGLIEAPMPPEPALLAAFAYRYIWWRDAQPPSDDRIIAQVMDLGTYDDVRRLEAAYGPQELRAVMLRAQPGWVGRRSWSFWRRRLSFADAGPIPDAPPRRSFHAEVL
jgi:hypothetical protein